MGSVARHPRARIARPSVATSNPPRSPSSSNGIARPREAWQRATDSGISRRLAFAINPTEIPESRLFRNHASRGRNISFEDDGLWDDGLHA